MVTSVLTTRCIHFVCREANQREREEKEHLMDEENSSTPGNKTSNEDEETKAAVVLQSNYRGFKERKRFKERKKAGTSPMAGTKLELPPNIKCELEGGQNERDNMADKAEENDEEEESTYEAEDSDDSDHTQVPEDEERIEEDIQEEDEQNNAAEEEETKAAIVLQSNFRGHKERKRLQEDGKIPASKHGAKSPTREEEVPVQGICIKETEKDAKDGVDVSSVEVILETQDETKAAVVLQSNFRGHKERKRLEEEGKIPKRKKGKKLSKGESHPGLDEERAATVLQSNFRGHQERKKLKEERKKQQTVKEGAISERETEEEAEEEHVLDLNDVVLEHKDEADVEKERLEEEQAAVKIQSHFRGFKDRKNLEANKEAAQMEAAQLESFSKEVMSSVCIFIQLTIIRRQ